jgi:hypothetical protein
LKTIVCLTSLLIGTFSALNAQAQTKSAQELAKIEERLKELEKKQEELLKSQTDVYFRSTEGNGRVNSYFGERMSFGGFFENALSGIWGPDTENQFSANTHLLGINIAATFNDKLRFNSQFLTGLNYSLVNAHNNPNLTPNHRQYLTPSFGAIVSQAYTEYSVNPALNIQTGLGYAAFGNSFQQRELVLFHRRNGPQMTSTSGSSGVGIAFPLWMGVHVNGAFSTDKGRTGYNAYTFSPTPKTLGVGSRVWWEPQENLTVGASYQAARLTNDNYYSYGSDINFKSGDYGVMAEYVRKVLYSGSSSPTSYYIEPYVNLAEGAWLIYVAADYLDNPEGGTTTIPDPFEKWVWGGGVNWLPTPNTRFRIGYLTHEYIGETASIRGQNRSYNSIDLSCGIAF